MLDLTPLERAVSQLGEALEFHDSELVASRPRLQLQLRAAAIQAFEFTYELGFAMLCRHLGQVMANPSAVKEMSFKDVIREALHRKLVPADVDSWEQFRKFRGTTSHTYDAGKAQAIFGATPEFLEEARYLLSRLQSDTGAK